MFARRDKSRDVRHVHHEVRPHGVRDLAHALEINKSRIGARAGDDELGSVALRRLKHLVVVDDLGLRLHAVEGRVEVLAGDGRPGAVGEVAAVAEIHAHYGVARLENGEIHRHVRLRAGVRLHVRVFRAEELLCPLYGQRLYLVDILAAAVVARSGVALGIFIGQVTAHSLHNGAGDEVLRRDHLQMVTLALQLPLH